VSTLSVIMPLYNKAPYVAAAIASVCHQTFTDWELWVVDNGSTDGGADIVELVQDHRVQLVRSPIRGPGAARNFGLTYATGEWVVFLDADDLVEPDYLATQIHTASQHPEASIIAGGWQEFQDQTPQQRVMKHPAGLGQPLQQVRDEAIAFVPWAVHAAMIRRSVLTAACLWPESLDGFLGEDLAFWFRLVSRYLVAYSPCRGALYRIQTPQCRTQRQDIHKWFAGLHGAIAHNMQDCQQRSCPITAGQYENLTRLYSQLYQQALAANDQTIATQAYHLARTYLQSYLAIAPYPKRSMQLRHLLGLRLFSRLMLHLS